MRRGQFHTPKHSSDTLYMFNKHNWGERKEDSYPFPLLSFRNLLTLFLMECVKGAPCLNKHVDCDINIQNPLVVKACLCEATLLHPPSRVSQCALVRNKLQGQWTQFRSGGSGRWTVTGDGEVIGQIVWTVQGSPLLTVIYPAGPRLWMVHYSLFISFWVCCFPTPLVSPFPSDVAVSPPLISFSCVFHGGPTASLSLPAPQVLDGNLDQCLSICTFPRMQQCFLPAFTKGASEASIPWRVSHTPKLSVRCARGDVGREDVIGINGHRHRDCIAFPRASCFQWVCAHFLEIIYANFLMKNSYSLPCC